MSKKMITVQCEPGIISEQAARGVAKIIIEYFQDPANMKAFEEWKKQKSTLN